MGRNQGAILLSDCQKLRKQILADAAAGNRSVFADMHPNALSNTPIPLTYLSPFHRVQPHENRTWKSGLSGRCSSDQTL